MSALPATQYRSSPAYRCEEEDGGVRPPPLRAPSLAADAREAPLWPSHEDTNESNAGARARPRATATASTSASTSMLVDVADAKKARREGGVDASSLNTAAAKGQIHSSPPLSPQGASASSSTSSPASTTPPTADTPHSTDGTGVGSSLATLAPPSPGLPQPRAATPMSPPRSHLNAHAAYLACCYAWPIDPASRNWNDEFQTLRAEMLELHVRSTGCFDRMRKLADEFETHCKKLVGALFREGRWRSAAAPDSGDGADAGVTFMSTNGVGPSSPAALGCTRHGNLVLRVWRDAKLGRNMQRCFRVLMETRAPFLFFPLTATFRHLHLCVSVQALIPLRPPASTSGDHDGGLPVVYRGDGGSDGVMWLPVYQYLAYALGALKYTLPSAAAERFEESADATRTAAAAAAIAKIPCVEVVDGLDERMYVVNPLGLVPSIIAPMHHAVPLRRWLHIIRHPPQPVGAVVPPAELFRESISSSPVYLSAALNVAENRRGERLVELLHDIGLNVCLLGLVAQRLHTTPKEDVTAYHEPLLRLILSEILARAVRELMFQQMKADHAPATLRSASAYLTRAVASCIDVPAERLVDGLLPVIHRLFLLDGAADDCTSDAITLLGGVLCDGVVPLVSLVQRLCQLSGLQMLRGAVNTILTLPSKHNLSSFFRPQHEELLASLASGEFDVALSDSFTTCFLRTLRADYLCRIGRPRAALEEVRQQVREASRVFPGQLFLHARLWLTTALVSAACGERGDAVMLCEKAQQVMDAVPAYVVANPSKISRLPTSFYFLRGRVKAHVVYGYVLSLLGSPLAAEREFNSGLRLADVLDVDESAHASQLRLEAVAGLVEAVSATEGSRHVARINQSWEVERRSLPPTHLGAQISEVLGSLMLERGNFAAAVDRLWECYNTLRLLRGERAYAVAEILNKLGFAYYLWDASRYSVYSSFFLRQAADIAEETCGLYSPQHQCILENIISLDIRCGRYVQASKKIHELQTLPPRYTLRVPRDHPVAIRLPEIEARLREKFEPVAVVMIQHCWREFTRKMLVRAVCERSAKDLQRVARGFLVRRTMGWLRLLARTCSLSESARQRAADEVQLRQQIPVVLGFSQPLINGSALFSKECRNFNGEYQHARIFHMWWDVAEAAEQRAVLNRLKEDFVAAAKAGAAAAHRDPTRSQLVADCSTSFVVDNIVYTHVARGSVLAHTQNAIFDSLRCIPQSPITAPLSTIIAHPSSPDGELYAEALIPLDRRPQFALLSDGHEGPQCNDMVRLAMHALVDQYRAAGLAPAAATAAVAATAATTGAGTTWTTLSSASLAGAQPTHIQGVEIVRATDEQHYITNALGLVFRALQEQRKSWDCPKTHCAVVAQHCAEGLAKDMTEPLEKLLITADPSNRGFHAYTSLMLACVRSSANLDRPTTHKYFQVACAELEELGLHREAMTANHNEARVCIRCDAPKSAIPPLLRNFYIMKEKVRLRPYFGSFYAVETARWLLASSQAADRPFDPGALRVTVNALDLGEPSPSLFTTCERFIAHYRRTGDRQTLEELLQLRERRAHALSAAESERYILQLKRECEEALKRGGDASYRDSTVRLVTAIHLAEVKHPDSVMLASLLTLNGWLQTTLSNLKLAQKSLSRAHRILTRTPTENSVEMFMWRKNNRTLKNRLRENAMLIIRRAVRRWKEQRRLRRELQRDNPAEYTKLMDAQLLRRINRLSVAEATRRIRVAEAEAEGWYQLGRLQRRGRNEAMLRQTYGSRVQLHLDKLTTAMVDLAELACETKVVIKEVYWRTHATMHTGSLLVEHRLCRRSVLAEWRADTLRLKLWHVENVATVVRFDFMRAMHTYLLRCVSAEERAWRRVIEKLQKRSRKLLGRRINKYLRSKPRNIHAELRALMVQEEKERAGVMDEEVNGITEIDDLLTFGVVAIEKPTDV